MIEEAIKRAIECEAMLYNRKRNCPDNQRDAELRQIYRLAEMAPDGPAIECGVFYGGSLVCWAMAREGRGEIIANDIEIRPELTENLRRYGLKVVKLQATATEAAGLVERVAFCFIDADHREGILSDIQVWPFKIIPGGILAFHDYGTWKPWQRVTGAVDEWMAVARWECLGQVGSLVAFRRPH